MKQQQLQALIDVLEEIKGRPRLFFSADVPPILNFLFGFNLASEELASINSVSWEHRFQVEKEFGWEPNAHHIAYKLTQAGKPPDEVIQITLEVEIETLRRTLQALTKANDTETPDIGD